MCSTEGSSLHKKDVFAERLGVVLGVNFLYNVWEQKLAKWLHINTTNFLWAADKSSAEPNHIQSLKFKSYTVLMLFNW